MSDSMFVTFIDEENVPHMVGASDCHLMWNNGKFLVHIKSNNRSYAFVGEIKYDGLVPALATFHGMIKGIISSGGGSAKA